MISFKQLIDSLYGFFSLQTKRKTENVRNQIVKEIVPRLKNPGLDCPQCGTLIVLTIEQLLNQIPIKCPNESCGLEISVNQKKSGESLKILRRLRDVKNNIDSFRDFKY